MKQTLLTGLLAASTGFSLVAYSQPQAKRVNDQDRQWMVRMVQSSRFEIELAKVAEDKAEEDVTRQFAQQMVTDHTAGLERLQQLATSEGISLPEDMTPDQEVLLEFFKDSDSVDWDKDYLTYEVKAHEALIDATQDEIDDGEDTEIIAAARAEMTTLETHAEAAQQAASSLPAACGATEPSPSPSPTDVPSPSPSPTLSPEPSPTVSPSPSPSPTLSPSPEPSPSPTEVPTPAPTPGGTARRR